ncbi:MAG: GTPase HflX, partial [Desulfatitalea sp.]|nr:GTPase HflX [Desulfatitalea sp.]NNJ99843.1 GTPase HflX [Desulfatitalea sp.]
MKKVWGQVKGLKANQLQRLEKLYRRKVPPEYLITPELSKDIALLSFEMQRQMGLLIDRAGKVACVLVGDPQGIFIPELSAYRLNPGRLR